MEIIFLSLGLIFFIASIVIVYRKKDSVKIERMIQNFVAYESVLKYFMEKAYDMIYKEDIMIYSVEAYGMKEEDINKVATKFTKLVLKLLGTRLVEEFSYFYGSEDTFFLQLVDYFNTKYESDEIRKTSMENIKEADIEEKSQ
jgi:hypothetical protein